MLIEMCDSFMVKEVLRGFLILPLDNQSLLQNRCILSLNLCCLDVYIEKSIKKKKIYIEKSWLGT